MVHEGDKRGLYTISPTVPFLETLVDALLAGEVVPGFGFASGFDLAKDPFALADVTLYLPTRRAARRLPEIFRKKLGASACLLPTIRPLGDVDEDSHRLASGAATSLPPELPPFARKLAMTRLVNAWEGALRRDVLHLRPGEDFAVPASTADAAWLAGDLLALMDEMQTEEVDWASIAQLAPQEHARYWQITLDFLQIAVQAWPEYLRECGAMDPKARRSALIRMEARRLRASPPRGPVIVAGATGSIPATAELMQSVFELEKGAIVLPGLDMHLDAKAWKMLGGEEAAEWRAPDGSAQRKLSTAPAHPQYSLKRLLSRLGADRADVTQLGAAASPALSMRERIVSEALRPAETTDLWPQFLKTTPEENRLEAFANVDLVTARNEVEEALALAVALREAVENGQEAALISPDRTLARRVSVELGRWGIVVDDSAGRPLDQTPPAALSSVVARVGFGEASPIELLTLLKHPLARLGLPAKAIRAAARSLERGVLRGPQPQAGMVGLKAAVAAARMFDEEQNAAGGRIPRWKKLVGDDWDAVEDLVERLARAIRPLEVLAEGESAVSSLELTRAHIEAVTQIARDETGADTELYAGEAGEALAAAFAGLLEAGDCGLEVPAREWPAVFAALIAGVSVRKRLPGDPRIAIFGPMEARLQRPDLVILAGLNEGTWPQRTRNDPWLNRPMKSGIGLDPPERRIGSAAHDFCQGMGARKVILSRAQRVEGAPAVASRWLQRLTTLLGETATSEMSKRGARYLEFASMLDQNLDPPRPARRPEPTPPLAARPKQISVTEVETLIRDPYAFYARKILRLDEVDPLGGQPGAADRGSIIHDCLHVFLRDWDGPFDERAVEELINIGKVRFASLEAFPAIRALWWPRFKRIAKAFVAYEAARVEVIAQRCLEIGGGINLPLGRDIRLTCRADRIDLLRSGGVAVIDYKTGQAPSVNQVTALLAPQLPLEAAIIQRGGFADVPGGHPIEDLLYLKLQNGRPAVSPEPRAPKDMSVGELAEEALARTQALFASYEDPAKGYLSRARVMKEKIFGGTYDHLARVQEWSVASEEEE